MLEFDRDRVEGHLSLLQAAYSVNDMVDVGLASAVARSLLALIDDATSFGFEERRLLAGAVEYFVLTGDSDNDMVSPVGLVDDAKVTNATAAALGRPELIIPVVD